MKRSALTKTNTANTGMIQPPKILTVAQIAALLQIPMSSVYEKTRRRLGVVPPLPCRRVGKYLRFEEDSVIRWFLALPESGSRKRRARKDAA